MLFINSALGECISDKKKHKLHWLYHNKIIKEAHTTPFGF